MASWQDGNESDNSDAEVEEDFFNHSTVVVLDNSEKMFEVPAAEEYCAFQHCLEALYNALDRHVFHKWTSRLRIQMLDGRETDVFFDLSRDLIEIMKKLLSEKDRPADELKAIYCSKSVDSGVFYESLLDACDCLRRAAQNNDSKNIVILTNDHECGECDPEDDELQRVVDMMQANKIELIVLPMKSQFKWETFYGKLVQRVMNEASTEDMIEEGFEDADSLCEVLDNFVQPKKNNVLVDFFYGPRGSSNKLLLQVRRAFKETKLVQNVKVDPKTKAECKSAVPRNAPGTSEVPDPLGESARDNEQLWSEEFEPQPELTSNKTNLKPLEVLASNTKFTKALASYGQRKTLRLLYLLPEKCTSAHYLNKPAFIVEPYSQMSSDYKKPIYRAQIRLFYMFWQHCYEGGKVMICTYVHNPRATDFLVQLEPKITSGYKYFEAQYVAFHNGVKGNTVAGLGEEQRGTCDSVDLSVACDLVSRLSLSDGSRAFQVECSDYETKAALIKAVLLSTRQDEWQPPEKSCNWPTQEQVDGKMGKEIAYKFNYAYVGNAASRSDAVQKKKRKL